MKIANSYHHLKGATLSRSESIEKFVLDSIIESDLSNEQRESSSHWEIMHSSTCKAFMHVLAEKRGLDVELARVAGALHDFYVIKTGKYKDHARLGADLVAEILNNTQQFSDQEITAIVDMVGNHSDKHIYSDNQYNELIKDADVFDCSLYEGTESYYLAKKPFPVCREYFERIKSVRAELGLPMPPGFEVLNDIRRSERIEVTNAFEDLKMVNPFVASVFLGAMSSYMATARPACIQMFCTKETSGLRVINSSTMRQSNIPDWHDIAAWLLRARAMVDNFNSAGTSLRMDAILREVTAFASCLWTGVLESDRVRRQASVSMACFECDDDADEKFSFLLHENIEGVLRQMLNSSSVEWFFESSQASSSVKPSGSEWELSSDDVTHLDRLARLRAMTKLRQILAVETSKLVDKFSLNDPNYYDSDIGFSGDISVKSIIVPPLSLLAGEVEHHYTDVNQDWGLLYWPRFNRSEYLRGDEVHTRIESLDTFLISPLS